MKYLRDIIELEGVKVLMRVDFNVPVRNGVIADDFRIRKIIPTIRFLHKKKAMIILMSHIEGGDKKDDMPTLAPVAEYLKKAGIGCVFIKDYKKVLRHNSPLILLENLRNNEGEKKNDRKFARELASLGDMYVNEAFAVSHREHASVCAITEFIPSYAGLLFAQEVEYLSTAVHPDHPFLFILGGAKFETKLSLLEKFMTIADKVFVGGALANNFFKEAGQDVGKSLVSSENFNLARFTRTSKLLLPLDTIVCDEAIVDVGPKTVAMLKAEIAKAKYILWNGPVGLYEKGFKESTLSIARMIAEATSAGAKTILGGGDTFAVLAELKIEDQFTFVSTGGGAMLEFLAKETLPGIEALEKSDL